DHLPFTRGPHAVTLDGLGEDDGRLALALHGGFIRCEDLCWIVTAAGQSPDAIVRPAGNHRRGFGIAAEEMLADVGAVLRFEILVVAVEAFLHELPQAA